MRKLIFLIICICYSAIGFSQNLIQYSNYIANQGLLNPAYNGTRDIISGLFIHRSQWVTMEGAPMNDAINVHGPIEDTNLGVGVCLQNDHVGLSNTLDFSGAASYKFQIDRKGTFLSLGLQLTASHFNFNANNQAVTVEYGDPVYANHESKLNFNFGFGSYFYAKNYFLGFSIPKFFANSYDTDQEELKNKVDFKQLHYYLYGGYIFPWGDVKVKPTLLVKNVVGAPMQFDLGVNVLVMEQLWLGLSYRSVSEVVFIGEYQVSRQWAVRYSFDYATTQLNNYAKYGSHELGVQFDFSFNKRAGMRSIRYF